MDKDMKMNFTFVASLFGVFLLAILNSYQALTGKRISKRPSRRSDEEMRRQSAIAAVVLGIVGILSVLVALRLF
jgi:hypothetical protein